MKLWPWPVKALPDPRSLAAWGHSPHAQPLMALEREQVAATLPTLIGYRLLQIGNWGFDDTLYQTSPMLQHWVVGLQGEAQGHVQSDGCSLPIATRSVDAVLLPHSLELVASPHRLLREVDRVLCHHGHVILSGFNPWGLWAARQRLPWGVWRYPRGARLYTLNRVRDWLELLDFEVIEVRRYGTGFPWLHGDDADRRHPLRLLCMPLSQAYQVLARKRVIPLTPARPRWRRGPVVTPAALPEARVHRVR